MEWGRGGGGCRDGGRWSEEEGRDAAFSGVFVYEMRGWGVWCGQREEKKDPMLLVCSSYLFCIMLAILSFSLGSLQVLSKYFMGRLS